MKSVYSAQVPGIALASLMLGMAGAYLSPPQRALVSARILSPIKRGQRNADPVIYSAQVPGVASRSVYANAVYFHDNFTQIGAAIDGNPRL